MRHWNPVAGHCPITLNRSGLEVAASPSYFLLTFGRALVSNQYPRKYGDKGCQNQKAAQRINPELPIQLVQILLHQDQPTLTFKDKDKLLFQEMYDKLAIRNTSL